MGNISCSLKRRCLNMSMGQIIYCSDLVLRIDSGEEVHNITEWLYESTEYRPVNPEGCVLRHEMTTLGKLSVILVVWIALIVLTTFYCYFCEQRLFPSKTKRLQESMTQNLSSETGNDHLEDSTTSSKPDSKGHNFQSNILSATLPKDNLRSRKERLASTCSCNSVASSSITGSVGPYRRFWQSAQVSHSLSSWPTTMTDLDHDHEDIILELDKSPKKPRRKRIWFRVEPREPRREAPRRATVVRAKRERLWGVTSI